MNNTKMMEMVLLFNKAVANGLKQIKKETMNTVTPIGTLEWDMKDGVDIAISQLVDTIPEHSDGKVCIYSRNYLLNVDNITGSIDKAGADTVDMLARQCLNELYVAKVMGVSKIWICFSMKIEGWSIMLECNAYRDNNACETKQCKSP